MLVTPEADPDCPSTAIGHVQSIELPKYSLPRFHRLPSISFPSALSLLPQEGTNAPPVGRLLWVPR